MTMIREARHSLGVTQSELARRLGVSVAAVSQTETREARGDLTVRTRSRYLEALGLADLGLVVPRAPAVADADLGLATRVTSIRPGSAAASSRSRRRSLMLHRLTEETVDWTDEASWLPRAREGIARVRRSTRGQAHLDNLRRWEQWVESRSTDTIRERMCAEDEDACCLREVSPMAGFLTDSQRLAIIQWERCHYEA
ncbi:MULTISPECIES: helix-turn-helix domain-containing protein [Actinomyces]|uniref:Helix-turn-helix transcriptional regulator n=1 Tax=Actinomyces respiraculi TaxID=2744574 RepID=A0A7T0PVX5_9ACTO|nr:MULTISPECIES: helix-turn-helix transcriptional regulator [Actinomyces]QPL05124.1 helix-turn-helix transcriptional regulator [Actinomyces respiraculi]